MSLIVPPESCIDNFYYWAGNREPLMASMNVQSGKLLVRKVAALFHAARSLPDGMPLLWLDFDVAFQQPAGGPLWAQLARFVSRQDVPYLPFKPSTFPNRVPPFKRIDTWAVESGVLAVRPDARTRQLLAWMLRHYDGRASELVRMCTCVQPVDRGEIELGVFRWEPL